MTTLKHTYKIISTVQLALSLVLIPIPTIAAQIVFADLSGGIDPFTYTDSSGTAATGIMSLTLNTGEQSFSEENISLGTFTEHLVADVNFDDGRGNSVDGTLIFDISGTFTPGGSMEEAGIASITSGVLNSPGGAFDGTTFTGLFGLKHFTDCTEGGIVWCYEFSAPPSTSSTIVMHLPSGFSGTTDISISGNITVQAVPIPPALALFLSSVVGLLSFARINNKSKVGAA